MSNERAAAAAAAAAATAADGIPAAINSTVPVR